MKWNRRFNVYDYLRTREATGYILLICTGLALLQAIFAPSAFSVLILAALLVVVLTGTNNYF